ncbi:RICIN domain-containing protein [Streptomyces sp. NPDC001744]|uniref:RICIN domain-containing protein n=1 Tax=Streptomyces sp. NPDC001744 TaxID=3364606 RepID=UPI0036ACA914
MAMAAGLTAGASASSPAHSTEANPVMVRSSTASAGHGLAARDGGIWYLVAKHSGKCLTVNGASQSKGAAVNQYDCVRRANQRWRVLYTGTDGLAYLVAEHSGKCMDAQGGSGSKGTKIIQWDCNGRRNQTFRARNLTGYVAFRPLHASRMCVDIPGASRRNNTQAVLWGCNLHANQAFKMVRA